MGYSATIQFLGKTWFYADKVFNTFEEAYNEVLVDFSFASVSPDDYLTVNVL